MTQRKELSLPASGDGLSLQVRFIWRDDRFVHTIAVENDAGITTPLLASCEGTASDDWPASPPLQTCSSETIDGEQAMLLVGMAGQAHWSVAVTPEAGAAALVFDIACRLKSAPLRLGSEYRTMLAPRVESARLATFDVNGVKVRLEHCPLENEPQARIEATAAGLAILVDAKENPAPRTIRWKYRIAAAPV